MSMVWSRGELRMVNLGDEPVVTPSRWWGGGQIGRIATLADPAAATYEAIYRTQRWVRTAVDFLARNVAQCKFLVYRRLPDDDRVRLRPEDHPYAAVMAAPDPDSKPPLTAFRWIAGLVADAAVYGNSFTAKRPDPDQARQLRLTRLESAYVWPDRYEAEPDLRLFYTKPGFPMEALTLADVIWMRAWSPTGVMGLSLLEPLREMLHEEFQASGYRGQLWASGARMSGWIKRGTDAPKWSAEAKERFQQDWQAQYAGSGAMAGGTPVLEDGMEFTQMVFSAEQAQFLQSRELNREEVASAFHIQPTMLGQTKGATYSNTKQHHEMLYTDTLGPIFADFQSEFQAQLLPEFVADNTGVYVEANIEEKLSGTFLDQIAALQTAVGAGRGWLTPNEARARLNLPRIDSKDADSIVVPLNVTLGGSVTPTEPPAAAPEPAGLTVREVPLLGSRFQNLESRTWKSQPELDRRQQELEAKLAGYFRRQRGDVLSALGAGEAITEAWDADRWDAELSDLVLRQSLPISSTAAQMILEQYAAEGLEWSDDPMIPPLTSYASRAATGINVTTYQAVTDALLSEDAQQALRDVFTYAMGVRAAQEAQTETTYATNLGQHDAAVACGLRAKTWTVTSSKPRASHAAMAGETVGMGEVFSNGARWPGDPSLGVDETAGCSCRLDYSTEEEASA